MQSDQNFHEHAMPSNREKEDDDDDFGCGLLVKLDTEAYKKALARKQIPFAAFLPANSKKVYLLKIVNCSEKKQLLEPATSDDVLQSYSRNTENFVTGNYKMDDRQSVAIVSFVVQKYNEEEKRMDLFVEPPSGKIDRPKLFKPGTLIDFALAPPEDDDDEDATVTAPQASNDQPEPDEDTVMDVDEPSVNEMEDQMDKANEPDQSPESSPIGFSMPTLVAVQLVDSNPTPEFSFNKGSYHSPIHKPIPELQPDAPLRSGPSKVSRLMI